MSEDKSQPGHVAYIYQGKDGYGILDVTTSISLPLKLIDAEVGYTFAEAQAQAYAKHPVLGGIIDPTSVKGFFKAYLYRSHDIVLGYQYKVYTSVQPSLELVIVEGATNQALAIRNIKNHYRHLL